MTVAPIEKSRRFDRQIRIWGAHGQSRFEEARICLLNASATGGEALKNLVLGGIAAFTIVDGQKVICCRDLLVVSSAMQLFFCHATTTATLIRKLRPP